MTGTIQWISSVNKVTLSLEWVAFMIIFMQTGVKNSDALMWHIGHEAIAFGARTQHLMQRGASTHQVASF